MLLFAGYTRQKGSGVPMQFLERNIGGPPPTQALLRTIPAGSRDPLVVDNNAPSSNHVETTTTFARATKDLGDVEAVVQVGKMWQSSDLYQDFDGSPVDVARFRKYEDGDAASAEARLASTGSAR
ncbi:MAG: hypothetical protein WDN24_10530 [Sphingomonas sp.]